MRTANTSAWHVGSRFEIAIEGLAAGGDGVGRVDGCVVFVPRSAPGDRLLVEVERVESRRLHAAIVAVIEPAAARREPACAHFGRCGGCAWQHVAADAQRAAKGRIVRETLLRLGGIELEQEVDVRGSAEYGWRSRAELHVARGADGRPSLGWLRRGSHEVEIVEECPVLVPALQRVLDEFRAGRRFVPRKAARVHLAAGDEEVVVGFDDAAGRPLEAQPEVTVRTVARVRFKIGARTFFQGNEHLVGDLVEVALAGLEGSADGGEREALDLYCGSGLFALPLSRHFTRVLGVEGDARAVELARANAADNGIENVRFECEDVSSHLHRARRMLRPRVVLLDPPRRGAGAVVVDAVAGLEPEEVRYVSCDPATLARDLQRFALHRYAVTSLVAFDLFPQTPHVECVAALRRAPARGG